MIKFLYKLILLLDRIYFTFKQVNEYDTYIKKSWHQSHRMCEIRAVGIFETSLERCIHLQNITAYSQDVVRISKKLRIDIRPRGDAHDSLRRSVREKCTQSRLVNSLLSDVRENGADFIEYFHSVRDHAIEVQAQINIVKARESLNKWPKL